MIYKGIMGEQEVTLLYNSFKRIYRFVSRGSSVILLTREKLAEVDIEPEVYNNIFSTDRDPNSILILNSNSDNSIVTKFAIYSAVGVSDWLTEKLKHSDFTELISDNSIFVLSDTRAPTSDIKTVAETMGDKMFYIYDRNTVAAISQMDLSHIESKIQDSTISNFDISTFQEYRTEISAINNYKAHSATSGVDKNVKPILFIVIRKQRFGFFSLINIGISKSKLGKNNDMIPGYLNNSFRLKQKFILTENFEVPNFNDLVDSDAQSLLLKKVKNYINRRVQKIPTTETDLFELSGYFGKGVKFDKNFFKPTNKILNSVYTHHIQRVDHTIFHDEIKELKMRSLNVENERIEERIGEAIAKSVKAYQEIWGSYKPIQRVFFTGKQKDYMRVRELFYNVLYAYIDKALGGYISGSGKRKYTPKLVEKILKALPTLDDNEKGVLQFMNRTEKIDDETYKKYFTIIEKFMSDRADALTSENIAINIIKGPASKVSVKKLLRKSGFSLKGRDDDDLYLITMVGIEGDGTETFENFKRNFKLTNNPFPDRFYRNLYQYVLEIDTINKDLNVIRPSLVDVATQFKINFQDWDIRVELVNLINNLISKPKQLITNKKRAGLSAIASPREKALELLSDERMRNQNVVNHPLTLHYEPLRFNKVTRQTSGHLFFENMDGKLVIFPFDSFYHDIEGQSNKTVDVCYTSVPSINDRRLFNGVVKNIIEAFYTWITDNEDKIIVESNNDEDEVTGNYQPITPQVYNALFIKALQSRLDGHIFDNRWGARAACVFIEPYEQGFYSLADEGMRMGMNEFPFDWKVFNRLLGRNVTTGLGSRDGDEFKNQISRLYAGIISEELKEHLLDEIQREDLAMFARWESSAQSRRVVNEVIFKLFKEFISEATYSSVVGDYHELRREELRKYLKRNPEAIQLKQIARRNLSRT